MRTALAGELSSLCRTALRTRFRAPPRGWCSGVGAAHCAGRHTPHRTRTCVSATLASLLTRHSLALPRLSAGLFVADRYSRLLARRHHLALYFVLIPVSARVVAQLCRLDTPLAPLITFALPRASENKPIPMAARVAVLAGARANRSAKLTPLRHAVAARHLGAQSRRRNRLWHRCIQGMSRDRQPGFLL